MYIRCDVFAVTSEGGCVSQETKEPNCLRLFLDYQGLQLLWSWMVDMPPHATHLKTLVSAVFCVRVIIKHAVSRMQPSSSHMKLLICDMDTVYMYSLAVCTVVSVIVL